MQTPQPASPETATRRTSEWRTGVPRGAAVGSLDRCSVESRLSRPIFGTKGLTLSRWLSTSVVRAGVAAKSLSARNSTRKSAELAYRRLVEQARQSVFLTEYRAPDTLRGTLRTNLSACVLISLSSRGRAAASESTLSELLRPGVCRFRSYFTRYGDRGFEPGEARGMNGASFLRPHPRP